jgi:hypothetical protein
MHGLSPVMIVARHVVPSADTRDGAIRMQNANAIIDFGLENTQQERSSTYEPTFWMQRASTVVAQGSHA